MANPSTARLDGERCWTLIGQRRGPIWYARRMRPTRGLPASVELDVEWTMSREESKADVVGFYHTHPNGSSRPSRRDVLTMRAWTLSFGKPLLCLIEADGVPAAYCFHSNRTDGELMRACELFPRGVVIVT